MGSALIVVTKQFKYVSFTLFAVSCRRVFLFAALACVPKSVRYLSTLSPLNTNATGVVDRRLRFEV